MRNLLLASLLAATSLSGCSSDAAALPALQGSYRVIAVFAHNAKRASSSVDTLKSSAGGIKDRDVAWFVIGPRDVASNIKDKPSRAQLEKLHDIDAFEVVLLGKDGRIKATQLGGLDLQALFNAIDQMPMRQTERQQP